MAGITSVAAATAGGLASCRKTPKRRGSQANPPATSATPTPARPSTPRTPGRRPAGVAGRGRVFEALHAHATDSKGQPARAPVEAMLDHLLRELTGKSKVDDAWSTLFRPEDVVGIKPNCRGSTWCSPSPALLDAVIARLVRVGVKPGNIIVWELAHFAKHPLYAHLKKSKIQTKLQDELGFHPQVHRLSTGVGLRFNKAIHQVTAILNIGAFKDHGRAGVTGALKNLSYGSIDNPREHHPNCCNPSTAEIYALPVLRDKVRLTLADAFRLIYDRGPTGFRSREFNIPYNRLYATTDPVAIDRELWQVLDAIRKQKGMDLLMKRSVGGKPNGRPHHVLTAAKLGLGEADYARIKVAKKTLG